MFDANYESQVQYYTDICGIIGLIVYCFLTIIVSCFCACLIRLYRRPWRISTLPFNRICERPSSCLPSGQCTFPPPTLLLCRQPHWLTVLGLLWYSTVQQDDLSIRGFSSPFHFQNFYLVIIIIVYGVISLYIYDN